MTRQYKPRMYAVGERIQKLRNQTGLTQTELAQLVGVSKRSILKWEGGEGLPSAAHLPALLATLTAHGAFTAGQERAEAEELWEQMRQAGTRRQGRFDARWFEQLLAERGDGQPSHHAGPDGQAAREPVAPAALPFQPTSFLGRAAEIAKIAEILGEPDCHLLTLIGPGGIGKTRLALAVAAQQAHSFPHGSAFVELAGIGSPNQIVSAVGDALGIFSAAHPDPTAHLLGYLSGRHMLLVLDNFEHLLPDTELVSAILKRAPRVTLLATSRERLSLQAEWLFDVEGLDYPREDPRGPDELRQLDDLAGYSAVQLLVQRARQIQPHVSLAGPNLAAVVGICRHTAGMPLAIELAAAAARSLPLSEIEQQIRANLDALATTLRDVPARHRSMRAVFEHSWRLLSEPERRLFSRLAVFRGGWTPAAAQQVAGATLAELALLADKSLVRSGSAEPQEFDPDAQPNGAPEPRFGMLEPLREYALEQLSARGELEALQHAHASHYLALAEAAAAQWGSPTDDAVTKQLDREHDNLRAALQWARDGGDLAIGLRLAGALRKFWQRRGWMREGQLWLAELLARAEALPDAIDLATELSAIQAAAWLASYQHDFAQAAALFERSIALQHKLGEASSEPQLFCNAAFQARAVGQYRRATALLEEAEALYRARGDRGSLSACGLGLAIYGLGLLSREQGDFARADQLFEACVELHRDLGDPEGVAQTMLAQSDSARDQGDLARMRAYLEPSLAVFRELGVQWAIGFAVNNQAQAAYLEGDLASAHALARESAALFRGLRADASLAEALVTLGQIERARGDKRAAHAALSEGLQLAWAVGPRLLVASALEGLAAGLVLYPSHAVLATWLLAGAAALRAQMGTPLRPVDQGGVDQTLAKARSGMGARAFVAAWQEGQALPLERLLSAIPDATALTPGRERSIG